MCLSGTAVEQSAVGAGEAAAVEVCGGAGRGGTAPRGCEHHRRLPGLILLHLRMLRSPSHYHDLRAISLGVLRSLGEESGGCTPEDLSLLQSSFT